MNLGFDDAMAKFVKISVESDCCQSFGICGEQFVSDIIFNSDGKVTATRFRFQHTMTYDDNDFIRDLVQTREITDIYSS